MFSPTKQENSPGAGLQRFIQSPLPEVTLFALALCLRLVGIQTRPLWYDEAFAVLFSEKGTAAMLHGTISPAIGNTAGAADVHPLLYYSLLNLWMKIFGSDPAAVRGLSVLFGLGAAVLLYMLGFALLGRRAALLVGLLVAVSPFQVHYSQEVRMYALMGLLVGGAALAMWRAMETGKFRWWLLFALLAAAAQYTHNLAAIHLVALAVTALFTRQKKIIFGVIFAGLGALLLYLPWLIRLPSQMARVSSGYWTEKPGLGRLITALLSYVTSLPLSGIWLPAGLFIVLFIFAIAVWQTLRAIRESPSEPETRCGLWLAWLAFAPAVLLFLISQFEPVFIERALLPSGAFFLVWLVWVFATTKMPVIVRWFVGGVLMFGMAIGLLNHWQYGGFPYADFERVEESLKSRYQDGDLILHSNKLTALPLIYYAPDLSQKYLADPPESGSDTLAPATQRVLGLLAEANIESATNGSMRVWFIIFERAIEEYRQAGYSDHPHLEWLDRNFTLIQVERFGDLQVFQFER